MTKRKTSGRRFDPMAAQRQRDQALAEKFERESWGLPPLQRRTAHKLTTTDTELMMTAAKFGGLEIGAPGSEVARLVEIGFLEIVQGGDAHRSVARITYAGALALVCRQDLRHETPKRTKAEAA